MSSLVHHNIDPHHHQRTLSSSTQATSPSYECNTISNANRDRIKSKAYESPPAASSSMSSLMLSTNTPLTNSLLGINQNILQINVGGQLFTTTKNTLRKSALFESLFDSNQFDEKETFLEQPQQQNENVNCHKTELVKTQTTFENFCVEHLENKSNQESSNTNTNDKKSNYPNGIYAINANYYFVDRSPDHFEDILHFLRTYPSVTATQFIERYYSIHHISSSTFDENKCHFGRKQLLKLQDEANFYKIHCLSSAIQDKLKEAIANELTLRIPSTSMSQTDTVDNESDQRRRDLSWWDQSGSLHGLRRIPGTRIAFATSMDNWCDKDRCFDAPFGYKWASQSEYLSEYYERREYLQKQKEWIHFGLGGWDNYRWKYARKIAFLFCDSFKSQRFIHSGMEVCDINHVKTIFGLMAESPLMEYDENKGIVEGFAGLVLLSDDVYTNKDEHNEEREDALSTASEWTSDEDDETIRSLKRGLNENNNNNNANAQKMNSKMAKVCYPNLPPPQLANTFAEYTKRQKAKLTKNNLKKHTEIEQKKHHSMSPNGLSCGALPFQPSGHRMVHSPLYPQSPYTPQANAMPLSKFILPIGAPQLTQRLSINSLPITSNVNNHQHTAKYPTK